MPPTTDDAISSSTGANGPHKRFRGNAHPPDAHDQCRGPAASSYAGSRPALRASRVVFMDYGRVVEVQKPESFFAAPQSDRAKDFLSKILTH